MQRVGFVCGLAIVFLFASCDISPMDTEIEQGVVADPENEGLQYLTVTYHSDLHTSGEVLVDPTRYPVPRFSNTLPPSIIVRGEFAILMGPGTLEKEGFQFEGWSPRQETHTRWYDGSADMVSTAGTGSTMLWKHIEERGTSAYVDRNLGFDAVWTPVTTGNQQPDW